MVCDPHELRGSFGVQWNLSLHLPLLFLFFLDLTGNSDLFMFQVNFGIILSVS